MYRYIHPNIILALVIACMAGNRGLPPRAALSQYAAFPQSDKVIGGRALTPALKSGFLFRGLASGGANEAYHFIVGTLKIYRDLP